MAQRLLLALLMIGALAPVACGGPDKVDSEEDIVGTWQRVGGGAESYCQYGEDGAYLCAESLGELGRNEGFQGEYWFEDGRYYDLITQESNCPEAGIYEIELLSSGNLKFILIEDECRDRVSGAVGRGIEEGKIEWQRVP